MLTSRELRVAILGVAIDNLTMAEVLETVEAQIAEGGFHQIATANVDFVIKSLRDDELREALSRCDLVLADGMPLVWASRLLGVKLKERVAGADLVPWLTRLAAQRGYRIFLLGASEESSTGTAAWMRKNFPSVQITGRHCPCFRPLEKMDHEEILVRIEEAKPDILLVAFGNPKQEKWLAMHRHRLQVPVCIGVGGSFDFLSGTIRRAPQWMQSCGMEWLYRTIQEPSRLSSRYFNNAVGLLFHLPGQLAANANQRRWHARVQINKETIGPARVFRIHGGLTGALLPRFEADVRGEIVAGSHVVLDFADTTHIGADALGSLVRLLGFVRRWKRELWLAGLGPLQFRVVRTARLGPSIRIVPHVSEALRRIEPEQLPVPLFEEDCAFFRVGGKLVRIKTRQMPEVFRQVRMLLEQTMIVEPTSIMSSDRMEQKALMQELLPPMTDELTAS